MDLQTYHTTSRHIVSHFRTFPEHLDSYVNSLATLIINLILLFQSTSVLAHKQESTRHLILPTSDDEALLSTMASDEPLGQQLEDLFVEMSRTFDATGSLLSTHRGWKGGVHIQSCGHHMHYDCRQSYCETLKQLMRVTREQVSVSENFFTFLLQIERPFKPPTQLQLHSEYQTLN